MSEILINTALASDVIAAIGQNPRLVQLLAGGSKPNLNELCREIIAQDAFLTNDSETLTMKQRAITLASSDKPVVIRGESGTGKELIAQILHGSRRGNLVAVNSTAVTETLFESELFGHVKGAFTGASENRAGLISFANEGTLFFDEIGDMPLSLQPKLLRVLQSRKFKLVGGNVEQPVRCRVVAATHMNLEEMVKVGKFRLDLYQRLACFQLRVKPLREKLGDVRLFVRDITLLEQLNNQMPALTFDGNIRELQNIIARWEMFKEINL